MVSIPGSVRSLILLSPVHGRRRGFLALLYIAGRVGSELLPFLSMGIRDYRMPHSQFERLPSPPSAPWRILGGRCEHVFDTTHVASGLAQNSPSAQYPQGPVRARSCFPLHLCAEFAQGFADHILLHNKTLIFRLRQRLQRVEFGRILCVFTRPRHIRAHELSVGQRLYSTFLV